MKVKIELLPGAKMPTYATDGSAGLDLWANPLNHEEDGLFESWLYIDRQQRILVKTGIKIEIPKGYVGLICARSGLALKLGITVLNGPGVIDSDYTGEIGVILHNTLLDNGVEVDLTKPIAQLVIVPAPKIELVQVTSLDDTDRGSGGFGSTDAKERSSK